MAPVSQYRSVVALSLSERQTVSDTACCLIQIFRSFSLVKLTSSLQVIGWIATYELLLLQQDNGQGLGSEGAQNSSNVILA
jgi:hypothetical protein